MKVKRRRIRRPSFDATVIPHHGGYAIVMPYPPSHNHYWIRAMRGMRISDEGTEYRDRVKRSLKEHGAPTLLGELRVCCAAHFPDARRRDSSNLWKVLLDVMQYAGIYENDHQVKTHRMVDIDIDRKAPRVDVWIDRLPAGWDRYAELPPHCTPDVFGTP